MYTYSWKKQHRFYLDLKFMPRKYKMFAHVRYIIYSKVKTTLLFKPTAKYILQYTILYMKTHIEHIFYLFQNYIVYRYNKEM